MQSIMPAVPGVAQAAQPFPQQQAPSMTPQQSVPIQPAPIPIQAPQQSGGVGTPVSNSTPTSTSSTTPDLTSFIQNARQQGVPDDQIFNYLHQNGMVPTNAVAQQGQAPQQGPQLSDTGSFLGNLGNSAKNLFGSLGNAIAHPIQTAENLGNLGTSALAHITGIAPATPNSQQIENILPQVANYYGQRYGSVDNFLKTLYQDPVGTAADASVLLDGLGSVVSGVGKVADAGTLADVGKTISTVGKGINPIEAVTQPVGAIAGATSDLAKAGLESIAPKLEASNLRLTPVQQVNFASKLADVTDYIAKNIPVGSPETRLEAAGQNVDKFENTIQNWLQTDAAGLTVPKSDILNAAEDIKSQFKNDRDYLAISNQVDDFKKLIDTRFPGDANTVDQTGATADAQVPLSDLNQLKRSTFKSAFNQTGTKVSDAVEYQLGDMMKSQIEQATENSPVLGKYPIKQVNQAYGIALNAQKLLKIAVGRPQVGFIDHLVSSAFGGAVGSSMGPLGTGMGAMVGEAAAKTVPMTAVKSLAGKAATAVAGAIPKIKIPAGITTAGNLASRMNTISKTKIKKK